MHSRSKRNDVIDTRGETVAWNGRWNDEPVELHAVSAHHASANIARFIGAQEQERARIARELHDAVGQHLAIMANELRKIHEKGIRGDVGESLGRVEGLVGEVARYLDDLGHRLHPAVLDLSGLVAALRNLCSEFQRREGIQVDVHITDAPRFRNKEASLALYRIVQEGLQNIKKHARSKSAEVAMTRSEDCLLLTVRDHGVGMSHKTKAHRKSRKGLGLIGMRERAHLLGGTVKVKSYPGYGTELIVEIPLQAVTRDGSKKPAA
jgi:two-component system sensor histidine kinase NreB